jgi:hypothetical protein
MTPDSGPYKVIARRPALARAKPRSPGHGPEGHGTEVFGALRLPNGNTLSAGGNNNRVLEVSPEG